LRRKRRKGRKDASQGERLVEDERWSLYI